MRVDMPSASSGCDLIFHHVNGNACNDLHSLTTVLPDGNSQLFVCNPKQYCPKSEFQTDGRHADTLKMSGLDQHE